MLIAFIFNWCYINDGVRRWCNSDLKNCAITLISIFYKCPLPLGTIFWFNSHLYAILFWVLYKVDYICHKEYQYLHIQKYLVTTAHGQWYGIVTWYRIFAYTTFPENVDIVFWHLIICKWNCVKALFLLNIFNYFISILNLFCFP